MAINLKAKPFYLSDEDIKDLVSAIQELDSDEKRELIESLKNLDDGLSTFVWWCIKSGYVSNDFLDKFNLAHKATLDLGNMITNPTLESAIRFDNSVELFEAADENFK